MGGVVCRVMMFMLMLGELGVSQPLSATSPVPSAYSKQESPGQESQGKKDPRLSHRPLPDPAAPRGEIQLDVTVTDAAGKPISGLAQDAFTLADNKTSQPILSFREIGGSPGKSEPPVEVILLVDVANTSFTRVAYERYELEKYLRRDHGHLPQPTTLMVFSDQGVKTQPRPSSDGNLLATTLEQTETHLHSIPLSGGYNAMERMTLSLKGLNLVLAAEQRKPGRKLLLWIGPGWPMLASPGFQFSNHDRQVIFNNIVGLSRALRESRVTLYSVFSPSPDAPDTLRADYYKSFLKGIESAKEVQPGDLSLSVLAVHSGGRAMTGSQDLGSKIAACVAEAAPYYVLGFDPPRAEHVDEYHAIDIRVNTQGAQARTAAGYYAQPSLSP